MDVVGGPVARSSSAVNLPARRDSDEGRTGIAAHRIGSFGRAGPRNLGDSDHRDQTPARCLCPARCTPSGLPHPANFVTGWGPATSYPKPNASTVSDPSSGRRWNVAPPDPRLRARGGADGCRSRSAPSPAAPAPVAAGRATRDACSGSTLRRSTAGTQSRPRCVTPRKNDRTESPGATVSVPIKPGADHPLRMRLALEFLAAREVETTVLSDPGRHVGPVHAAVHAPLISELTRLRSACGASVRPTGGPWPPRGEERLLPICLACARRVRAESG